jgi:Ca-activated chloride channel family protein
MDISQRSRWILMSFCFALALLVVNLFAPAVNAQGIIIDPPIEPPAVIAPLPVAAIALDEHHVEAVIDGPVANVHVSQIFRNQSGRTVEGRYLFPLPADAAVSDFQLTVDGQVLEGKLLNKEEARRIYEEIVRRQLDPALLEYMGRGLFQTSVFPIPAGATRKVALTYTQVVRQHGGLYEFVYPLRSQQIGASPVKQMSIAVELRNQPGLRTIYSPDHAISIDHESESGAIIGYEASNLQPEQDFSLFFGVDKSAVGLNLLSYKPAGEDGFFVLLAAPSVEVAPAQIVARDLVLVLDISGSMQGEKMEQARAAAHFLVDALNPDDRFNLVAFSTGVRLWEGALQPADAAHRQAAHAWIDTLAAGGSTDINRALLEGLGQFVGGDNDTRPAYLLFLTDGLPTMGETEPGRIIQNAQNNRPDRTIRLFTFGLGFDVNTDLLDTLSRDLGGRSSYVSPTEAIDEQVSSFYEDISTPVLVDISLNFGNVVTVDELFPYPLPDLFAGDQLVVVGRYRKAGPVTVTLRGSANAETLTFQYPGRELVSAGGESFVARLWATRKIGALLDQIRRSGPLAELVEAVTELSLEYGIVTPYTSYLVVEPALARATPGAEVPLYSLRDEAEEAVQESASMVASAAASGEAAVSASKVRSELANAANVQERAGVRYVKGKTFVHQTTVQRSDGRQVEVWVDTLYNNQMKVEEVRFGSERYFALARQPGMAAWLAISPELVIVLNDGRAIRITLGE